MTSAEQHDRFSSWLGEHAAILHHVANGFADGADRQDLIQELMLALWRAAPAYRGEARETTFIYRVVHNAALTWRRAQSNYRKRIENYKKLVDASRSASPGSPPEANELVELVYARIRELPPLDRSLILLSLDGLSYGQIAAIHGLSANNVGVRLNRLKQKLTNSMEDISHELR